jgi:hypothetical protein
MKCFHPMCTVSPQTGGALYRINAKGQPGIWACREHLQNTDGKIDPTVDKLTSIIEGSSGNGRGD